MSIARKKNRKRQLRRQRTVRRLCAEPLEERRLLTIAPIQLHDGELTIDGTSGSDYAEVRTVPSLSPWLDDRIEVTLNDTRVSFVADDVDRIVFQGGSGNDTFYNNTNVRATIRGEGGNDRLYGGTNRDYINGGSGSDTIYGGNGNDGLFGGADSSRDEMNGGAGDDRFLSRSGDSLEDLHSNDVKIQIWDGSSAWTDREIANVDQAFKELYGRTGTTRILKDTKYRDPLTFVKEDTAHAVYDGVAYAGLNETVWHRSQQRQIHICDWNESNDDANWSRRRTVIHEIGHN